ncbi:hypothetical protein EBS_1306 [endosymbiont of unidentified scaly snail isolate Monju]|nr:hypothetical protein EBS_1306 [endosymbiont of unidentified scaly snail isolate Monju]
MKGSVYDDICFTDQISQRPRSSIVFHHQHACLALIACPNPDIVTIKYLFTYFVVGALNADCDISKTMRLEGVYRPTADGTETENDRFALVAVMPIDTFELQGMYYCAIASHFVVLIERVAANLTVRSPNKHFLKGNERQLTIECSLGDIPLLYTMHIAPKCSSFAKFL